MKIDDRGNIIFSDTVQVAPLRSFKGFLADNYSSPPMNDLTKWNKRITTNLLYYQTNYFLSALLLVLSFGLYSGEELFYGLLILALVGVVGFGLTTQRPEVVELRSAHPYPTLGAALLAAYLLLSQLPSIIYFTFAVLFTLAAVLAHSSLRCTNIAGRVNLELENVHLRNTVMAAVLRAANVEIK